MTNPKNAPTLNTYFKYFIEKDQVKKDKLKTNKFKMVGLYKAKLGFKFKKYPPFELTRAVMSN